MNADTTKRVIAIARFLFGALLIAQAVPLMDRAFLDTLPGMLNTFANANSYDPVRWVVYSILIPQIQFVGAAFVIGQLLLGLSLTMGFLTRTFSLLGFIYAGLFFLMTQHMGWVYQHDAILMAFSFGVLAAIDAGRCYGLDGYLFHRSYQPNYKSGKKQPYKPKKIQNPPAMKKRAKLPPNLFDEELEEENV